MTQKHIPRYWHIMRKNHWSPNVYFIYRYIGAVKRLSLVIMTPMDDNQYHFATIMVGDDIIISGDVAVAQGPGHRQ